MLMHKPGRKRRRVASLSSESSEDMAEHGLSFAIERESKNVVLIPGEESCDRHRYVVLEPLSDEHVADFGIKLVENNLDPFDDNYVYCEECQSYYDYSCREHPLYYAKNRQPSEKESQKTRAEETLPAFLEVKHSNIPDAGRGVFTKVTLPVGLVFGPYEGILREKPPKPEDEEDGYAWELRRPREASMYIDAADPRYSNWMRYVNSPRHESEQNLVAFQYCGCIFYRVFRPVKTGEEILVWYGKQFGKELGIFKCNNRPKPCSRNPFIFD